MITGLPPAPLVSGGGGVFAAIGSSLSYSANATSVTITPDLGVGVVIPAATSALAGMLDAPRAALIDALAPVAFSGDFSDLVNQPDRTALISLVFDGGGSAIVAPVTRYLYIPFAATIVGWALLADASGSISVDVWKEPISGFPPLVANSITGGNPMALAAQASAISPTPLTGWTTQINAGDCLAFNVTSSSTVKAVTAQLVVTH